MHLSVPREPLFILSTLQSHGYEGYIVGGAVRDVIMAALKNPQLGELGLRSVDGAPSPAGSQAAVDYDFTTNATPEQILAIFPNSFYENQFGTVSIAPKHLREMMGVAVETAPSAAVDASTTFDHTPRVIDIAKATKIHVSLQEAIANPETLPDLAPKISEKNYEITTFRSESTYRDHRRPSAVEWGQTIEADLSRRDFTINAMALRIPQLVLNEVLNVDGGGRALSERVRAAQRHVASEEATLPPLTPSQYHLIDLHRGMKDLAESEIRTVGDAAERFAEDALRMLRAIRFAVQLEMHLAPDVLSAIQSLAADIQHVSGERVRDELLKMLASNHPGQAIELLETAGLLQYILPELREGQGVEQGGHHTTDVWTHSLDALDACPSTDPIVRLATLLHDIGKPRTFRKNRSGNAGAATGGITFYNHELVGARMARAITARLRLSRRDSERVYTLVREHMFYYQPKNTDAAIRRFMRHVGLDNVDDILAVREADRLGSGARKTSWRLEEMKARMVAQLHQPFAITDLAIDGTDLMNELGLKPGPEIGRILKSLFAEVLDKPELNEKEILLKKAKELLP